jgi:hypothetical protein
MESAYFYIAVGAMPNIFVRTHEVSRDWFLSASYVGSSRDLLAYETLAP